MKELETLASRRLKRSVLGAGGALLLFTLPCLLLGCPGELEDPGRFDAGAGGGSSTSTSTSSGTGGASSTSSTSTSGAGAGGGSSSGAGGAGGG